MIVDIYCLHYNNYYTRIYKREKTLLDYLATQDAGAYEVYSNIMNFNPADGVNTQQVIDYPEGFIETKDYAIVVDHNTDTIISRWFILDAEYSRTFQYTLTLRRDLLADFHDIAFDSVSFIEKAMLPAGNNLIFNSENMQYNQIKSGEVLLKDTTQVPWIVGYYSRGTDFSKDSIVSAESYDFIVNSNKDDWEYAAYTSSNPFKGVPFGGTFLSNARTQSGITYELKEIQTDSSSVNSISATSVTDNIVSFSNMTWDNIIEGYRTYVVSDYDVLMSKLSGEPEITTQASFEELYKYNKKIIKFNDGYYSCVVDKTGGATTDFINATPGLPLYNRYLEDVAKFGGSYVSSNGPKYSYMYSTYVVRLTEWPVATYTIPDFGQNIAHTLDQPFDIFCMKYNDTNLLIASELVKAHSTEIYDCQILPYCPFQTIPAASSMRSAIKKGEADTGDYVYHVQRSSFTKTIDVSDITWLQQKDSAIETKVQSECDMIRICSPNYSGVFEMNVAKNRGVSKINVSCTYIPYNPYIRVAPEFGGLYGDSYDDNRGLICGGDFSIAQINDQWKTYQINNKNYQNIFNRQIENMEVSNRLGLISDIAGSVAGTIQGAGAGALFGAATGVAGGVLSAGAGIGDVIMNQQMRSEQMDYTKDLFSMNMQNIRALPNTLTKNTAFNIDNKYFPFIEYYTCSEEEKEALRNKVKYNGMTVGVISNPKDFILDSVSYIKAKLIRPTNTIATEDYHLLNSIGEELNKGVFI